MLPERSRRTMLRITADGAVGPGIYTKDPALDVLKWAVPVLAPPRLTPSMIVPALRATQGAEDRKEHRTRFPRVCTQCVRWADSVRRYQLRGWSCAHPFGAAVDNLGSVPIDRSARQQREQDGLFSGEHLGPMRALLCGQCYEDIRLTTIGQQAHDAVGTLPNKDPSSVQLRPYGFRASLSATGTPPVTAIRFRLPSSCVLPPAQNTIVDHPERKPDS